MLTTDECKCRKPKGCWGQEGWHFSRWSKEKFVLRQMSAMVTAHHGPVSDDQLGIWKQLAEQQSVGYEGAPFAYERCPEHAGKVQSEVQKNRLRKGGKRLDLEDE